MHVPVLDAAHNLACMNDLTSQNVIYKNIIITYW